ncbi:MAG: polymer-forming cytoskeletal protein [Gemmatimonadota bacterium]|nr:MAG: polymer-forming cytoskeletal protein [Gemmatimonadota bacterium]
MAMFSSTARDSGPRPSPRPNGPEGLSILAAGTRVTGELEVDGVIKIEGALKGTVKAQGQVLVVKGGRVEGDIIARQAVIGGEVHGGVLADDRVEIQATSVVNGDITTPQITVLEGGKINGKINMAKPAAMDQKPRPSGEHGSEKKIPTPQVGELRRTG